MFLFMNNLFRSVRTAKTKRPARPALPRAYLQVESLEDRTVPTAIGVGNKVATLPVLSSAPVTTVQQLQTTPASGTPLSWTAPSNTANAIELEVFSFQPGSGLIWIYDNGNLVASQDVASTSSITITGSSAVANSFQIAETPWGIPTTVNFATVADSATVGDALGVQNINGPLTINGTGENPIFVNDARDTGTRTATISATSITGLSPAAINFSNVGTPEVNGSAGPSNVYTITGPVSFTDKSTTDTLYVYANAGTEKVNGLIGDSAYLYGLTTGTNTFIAYPDSASVTGPGYSETVFNMNTIVATSSSGSDVAYLYDLGNTDTFTATPTLSSMGCAGVYSNEAANFPSVYAYSTSSKNLANLDGGSAFNTVVASASDSYMAGAGYYAEASGFTTVNAASQTGNDTVDFYGGGSFTATPHLAQATLGGTSIQASNFGSVYEYLTSSAFELTSSGNLYQYIQAVNFTALVKTSGPGSGIGNVSNNYWAQVDSGVSTVAVGQLVSSNFIWDLSGAGNVAHQFGGASTAASNDVSLFNMLSDPKVRAIVFQDTVRDGVLGYGEMLDVYKTIESEGSLSSASFIDLETLDTYGSDMGMPAAIQNLAGKVVYGDPGNSEYQFAYSGGVHAQPLGDLTVTSSATQLAELVNKWFLGMNDPQPGPGLFYEPAASSVPLTSGGFNYYDVHQNGADDCWLLSGLAEVAAREPSVLQSMFTFEGVAKDAEGNQVSVYAVRFYKNGTPYYVTVNTDLPDGGNGSGDSDDINYDLPNGTTSAALWVALAEKAYIQANSSGAVQTSYENTDSYSALSYGYGNWALSAITGLSSNLLTLPPKDVANDWAGGDLMVMATYQPPAASDIVPRHDYAIVAYNPTQGFELYNPWGIKGSADSYKQSQQQYFDLFWATPSMLTSDVSGVFYAGSGMAPANAVSNDVPQHSTQTVGTLNPASNYQPGDLVLNDVPRLSTQTADSQRPATNYQPGSYDYAVIHVEDSGDKLGQDLLGWDLFLETPARHHR